MINNGLCIKNSNIKSFLWNISFEFNPELVWNLTNINSYIIS